MPRARPTPGALRAHRLRRRPAVAVVPMLAAVLLMAGGCVATLERATHRSEVEALFERRGVDPAGVPLPNQLTPEMEHWIDEQVRSTDPSHERLRQLLFALEDPDDLGLVYEPGYTGTAAEVFETHRFNCLSFSHLFVAMARYIGVQAYYLAVDEIERYSREGDLVVVSGHVTAGYGRGPDRNVLEFNVGPEVNYRSARPVSDAHALAMFYSNRGAELLRDGDPRGAREWIELAVALEPAYADAWVNLGVARRRSGDLVGAEAAYQRAVELEPSSFSGYHNLSTLMRMRGEKQAAREILRLLDRRDNRDPFIYLALGDDSLEEGLLEDAERFYRRALRLSSRHPEARAAMGQWALAAGDPESARAWLERARQDGGGGGRVAELAEALEKAGGRDG